MKHLTVDEIIDFISLTELNRDSIKLCATVNAHLCECDKCLELTKAFKAIHDEFVKLEKDKDFKEFINERLIELQPGAKEYDGYR